MKEVIQDLTEPMKKLQKCRIWCVHVDVLSINHAYYVEILKQLHEAKGPELWPNYWILHHDRTPAHKALLSNSFWPKNQLLKWNTHFIP
jgi:hypothetical protein